MSLKEPGLWCQIEALLLASFVTLEKTLILSQHGLPYLCENNPCFSHLRKDENV